MIAHYSFASCGCTHAENGHVSLVVSLGQMKEITVRPADTPKRMKLVVRLASMNAYKGGWSSQCLIGTYIICAYKFIPVNNVFMLKLNLQSQRGRVSVVVIVTGSEDQNIYFSIYRIVYMVQCVWNRTLSTSEEKCSGSLPQSWVCSGRGQYPAYCLRRTDITSLIL